ncbi:hypothetical protein [Morganella morganii]|uniref:hypothetical protein n=1 Tax=Morganella morganii TaxID=582 RepID=UPI001C496324|nr:hypothetical protein [Morganella morganii]QXO67014.1 hypothetical protein JC825_08945 [Morganella morganii]
MEYSVLVTFDLAYCKSPEYDLMKSVLIDTMKFKTTSKASGAKLPGNTYLGEVSIHLSGTTSDSINSGAREALNNVSDKLRKAAQDADITGKFYAIASPKDSTTDYCSR